MQCLLVSIKQILPRQAVAKPQCHLSHHHCVYSLATNLRTEIHSVYFVRSWKMLLNDCCKKNEHGRTFKELEWEASDHSDQLSKLHSTADVLKAQVKANVGLNVRIWRLDRDGIISACWGFWRDRRVGVQPNLSANSWRTYWTWMRHPCLTESTVLCVPDQRREKNLDSLLLGSISFMSGMRFCQQDLLQHTPSLSGKEALCLPRLGSDYTAAVSKKRATFGGVKEELFLLS